MKFEVGDKVRCIKPYCKFNSNDTYTIKYVKGNMVGTDHWDDTAAHHYASRFELVEENMIELEELIKKANKGYAAADNIRRLYKDQVEIRSDETMGEYTDIFGESNTPSRNKNRHIRIKSKIHKFKVAQWDAEINGEIVTIGCQKFDKELLKESLNKLVTGLHSNAGDLSARRNGILFKEHHITWKQAEELLKELENENKEDDWL